MLNWWRSHRERRWNCGTFVDCGPADCFGGYHATPPDIGGHFGVRRPLRFLAWKLELEEPQVAELAAILDELKTERAQAAVDDRRATSALADALAAEPFDEARIAALTADRVKAAERVQTALTKALTKMRNALDAEQRKRLAHLIRTGAIAI
jgi:Spy/CpxP family protein refolding chaperone